MCIDMCTGMCTGTGDGIEAGVAGTAGTDCEQRVSILTHAWTILDTWPDACPMACLTYPLHAERMSRVFVQHVEHISDTCLTHVYSKSCLTHVAL